MYVNTRDINLRKLFPDAARREEVLVALKRSWVKIVGIRLARYSAPYKLGVNELCVYFASSAAKSQLMMAKGTIIRGMVKNFGYKVGASFVLTLTDNIPFDREPMERKAAVIPEVKVDEETVRQYMQGAPETLPEDINYALSHFMAFLDKRFPGRSTT